MKNYLNIIYYIKILYNEGTEWEYKRILGNGQRTTNPNFFKQKIIKRALIAIPCVIIFSLLKTGFTNDFVTDVMTILSIFIGLFINVIVIVYGKYTTIPEITSTTSNNVRIETIKLKNFLNQFTFVTGKNLLISTYIILLLTVIILFKDFFSTNVFNYTFAKPSFASAYLFFKLTLITLIRIQVIYLLIDFFLLLLYSLGALFAFMKREMT